MTCTHFPDEKTRTVREEKTVHREVILLPSELSSLSAESASSRLQKYLDASETASSVVILYYWSVSEGLQNREHSWQVRILRGTNTVSATRSSPGPDLLFFFFFPQSLTHVLIKLSTSSGGRKCTQVKDCFSKLWYWGGLCTASPAETITDEALVDGPNFHLIKCLSIRKNNLFSFNI